MRERYCQFISSIIIIFSISTLASAQQDSFQTELNYNYTASDFDHGYERIRELLVTYHLQAIDTKNKPLAEAAFLDRSPKLDFLYSIHDNGADDKYGDGYIAIARYTYMQPDSSLWFNFLQGNAKFDEQNTFKPPQPSEARDIDIFGIGIGLRFGNSLLAYQRTEVDFLITEKSPLNPQLQKNFTEIDSLLLLKSIFLLDHNRSINMKLSAGTKRNRNHMTAPIRNEVYQLTIDYFLTKYFGLGIELNNTTGTASRHKGEEFTIRTNWYISPSIYLQAGYGEFKHHAGKDNYEQYQIGLGVRF